MCGFIGRRREIEAIENAWKSSAPSFIPIYGRRRVGKSALILEFLKARRGLYYLGKRAPAVLQIKEFLGEAAIAMDEPLLAQIRPEDWKAALAQVTSRRRGDGKLVLVLDEFQWMAESSPELPSVIQEMWDLHWQKDPRMMLILCGSYIGFMEREILGRKSPLFGRRTAQIFLKPFDYLESSLFHPTYSTVDRARSYFICGGIPLYLNAFSERDSIETNICNSLLDEYAPLRHEPEFLLREELREVTHYYEILLALSAGSLSAGDLGRKTSIPERSLPYYLQQLSNLDYIEKRHPLTGEKPAARHVRYSIKDPLLRFWFRFIFPNTSFLSQRGPHETFKARIRPEIDSYFGTCFERLCREALPFIYAGEGVCSGFEVGEYWDKSTQIDVVGLREDNWVDIGECKWGNLRSINPLLLELDAKVRVYPNRRNATVGKRLFIRQAVGAKTSVPAGVKIHTLEQLFGLSHPLISPPLRRPA